MSFSDRLKRARESKNLSQQAIADMLNVTDGTISNYEKGVAFPRWDTLKKLCDILSVDPNYMFWDDLSDNLKNKITNNMSCEIDSGMKLYALLDEIDKAEIRGEMKQMLKDKKYSNINSSIFNDIANDIGKIHNNANTRTLSKQK